MNIFGKEIPPRDPNDDTPLTGKEILGTLGGKWSAEDHIDTTPQRPPMLSAEEIRHMPGDFRRSALDVDSLVEKARTGEPLIMVEELDQFYDQWVEYAHQHGFMSTTPAVDGSLPVRELAQARREAIKLASDKNYDALRAKLEELSGPAVEHIDAAIEADRKRAEEVRELHPQEQRKAQELAIEKIEALRARQREADTVTPNVDESGENVLELTPEMSVAHRRKVARDKILAPARDITKINEELARRAGVSEERDAAQRALSERYAPMKEFLRAERAFKKIKKPSEEQKAEFEQFRKAYEDSKTANVESQLVYVAKLQESVKERIAKKGLSEEEGAKLLKRYNRMVRVREVVIPNKRQENEVRAELLDEKGRNIFQKLQKFNEDILKKMQGGARNLILMTPWGAKMSEATLERTSRHAVRLARVVGFATIGTAAGLGVGALFGGPAAATLLAAAGVRVLKGIGSTAAGATVGYALGKNFEHGKGKRLSEAFEQMQGLEILSAADLEAQAEAEQRGSAAAIRAGVVKRENIGATLTGFSVALTSAIESGAISHAAHWLHDFFNGKEPPAALVPESTPKNIHTEMSHGPAAAPAPQHVDAPQQPVQQAGTGPKESGSLIAEATIDKKGEGTNKLFEELQANIKGKGIPEEQQSPALKHFLGSTSNKLSREIGKAFGKHGMVTHQGDQFSVDEQQNIYFQPKGGEKQLFIENVKGGKGYEVHELAPKVSGHHLHAHEAKPTSSPEIQPKASAPVSRVPESQPSQSVTANAKEPEAPEVAPKASMPETQTAPSPAHAFHTQTPETHTAAPVGTADQVPESVHDATPAAPETVHVTNSEPAENIVVIGNRAPFTNSHGVEIRPNEPHVYQVKKGQPPVVWGGTYKERHAAVLRLLNDPDTKIKTGDSTIIFFEDDVIDAKTGKPIMHYAMRTPDGEVGFSPPSTEKHGGFLGLFSKTRPMQMPDPSKFIKRLQ